MCTLLACLALSFTQQIKHEPTAIAPVAPLAKAGALVPQQDGLPPLANENLEHPVLDHLVSLHTELSVFMWGDSTMREQFKLLRALLGGPSYDRQTDAGRWHPNVALPAELMHGNNGASAMWCPSVDAFSHKAASGNATISILGAFCTLRATSVAMVPALLDALQQMPYNLTLPADSLMYIGGAGLHLLHIETLHMREWTEMKPLEAAFEENTKYGLTELQERYPAARLAYFNTHSLCNELILSMSCAAHANCNAQFGAGVMQRAVACDSHDWKTCFSGVDVQPEERESFRETLYSHHGAALMAARERALLKDPSLKWALVDGHSITNDASCDQTEDGIHYNLPTMMKMIEEALTLLRRKESEW